MSFHQNLKNCTISLNKSKGDLTNRLANLSESFDRIKSLLFGKKDKLFIKLFEKESIKIKAIDANPTLINMIETFTKLTNSKKFLNNPMKNRQETVKNFNENISENEEEVNEKPKTVKKTNENKIFEEPKIVVKRKIIRKEQSDEYDIQNVKGKLGTFVRYVYSSRNYQ